MLRRVRALLAAHFVFACAACAQLPSEPKLKAFGQATSSVAAIFKDSVGVNAELAQRAGEEEAVQEFLVGDKDDGDFSFPPVDFNAISSEALRSRVQLINAIEEYAKALASAGENATTADLEAAAIGLGAAVATTVAPIVGSAAIPLVSPAAKWIGRGIGLAAANAYSLEIREIMRRTDPVLIKAVDELKFTFQIIIKNNKDKLVTLKSQKHSLLRAIRSDRQVSRSVLNAEYRAAANDIRAIEGRYRALEQYSRLLDAMATAHRALLEGRADSDSALTTFIDLAKELGTFATAMKAKQ